MDLKEWSVNYVKNRDLMLKTLVSADEKSDRVTFKFKSKTEDYYPLDRLDESCLGISSESDYVTVVCLNIDENFEFLLKNWDELKEDSKVKFLFVNVETNSKWIISPHSHSKVADPESLELGLKSMFEQASSE